MLQFVGGRTSLKAKVVPNRCSVVWAHSCFGSTYSWSATFCFGLELLVFTCGYLRFVWCLLGVCSVFVWNLKSTFFRYLVSIDILLYSGSRSIVEFVL